MKKRIVVFFLLVSVLITGQEPVTKDISATWVSIGSLMSLFNEYKQEKNFVLRTVAQYNTELQGIAIGTYLFLQEKVNNKYLCEKYVEHSLCKVVIKKINDHDYYYFSDYADYYLINDTSIFNDSNLLTVRYVEENPKPFYIKTFNAIPLTFENRKESQNEGK